MLQIKRTCRRAAAMSGSTNRSPKITFGVYRFRHSATRLLGYPVTSLSLGKFALQESRHFADHIKRHSECRYIQYTVKYFIVSVSPKTSAIFSGAFLQHLN